MLKFACAYKMGGDYNIDDVVCLSRQVKAQLSIPHEFVVLSDDPDLVSDSYITVKKLNQDKWWGWWCVIEVFRLTGPTFFVGLDNIFMGSLDRVGELALTCPPDEIYMARPQPMALKRGDLYSSAMMIWNGDWRWIYEQLTPKHIKRFVGEEKYTSWQLHRNNCKVRFFQDYHTGFYSYKNDLLRRFNGRVPEDAQIITFHGHPRPSQCKERWIQDIRNRGSLHAC